jgi:hypothetical protein
MAQFDPEKQALVGTGGLLAPTPSDRLCVDRRMP